MTQLQIYVLLEYSAIITIIVGIFRWKRISSFLKWQVLALVIMLIGDFMANSPSVVKNINAWINNFYEMNYPEDNNIPIYFISYPIALTAIVCSWVRVPEYDAVVRKRIYWFLIAPIVAIIAWCIFQSWSTTPMFFQDYALVGLLHSAVLLAVSLQFFYIFLNTEVFEPQLKNAFFIVACAHMIFAVPSTFIVLLSAVSDSSVATDIWIGREVAYCLSNFAMILAFFVKK